MSVTNHDHLLADRIVYAIAPEFVRLHDKMDDRFDRMDDRLDKMDGVLNRICDRLDAIEKRLP